MRDEVRAFLMRQLRTCHASPHASGPAEKPGPGIGPVNGRPRRSAWLVFSIGPAPGAGPGSCAHPGEGCCCAGHCSCAHP